MISGETVTVLTPTVAYDANKDPVTTWAEAEVGNVLFGYPSTEDADGAMRAFGVRAAYKLGIPKEFTGSLRGCKVRRHRDGAVFDIAGDPQPLPPELCPTPWNREAIAGWVDG